jgi:hypothetical protein
MVWFFERDSARLICEIRRAVDDDAYEFELGGAGGTREMQRFQSPSELIDAYLRRQSALRAEGWRPLSPEPMSFFG